MDTIAPKEIGEWLAGQMEEKDWASATFNCYKAAISKEYKLGMQYRNVSTNPRNLCLRRKRVQAGTGS